MYNKHFMAIKLPWSKDSNKPIEKIKLHFVATIFLMIVTLFGCVFFELLGLMFSWPTVFIWYFFAIFFPIFINAPIYIISTFLWYYFLLSPAFNKEGYRGIIYSLALFVLTGIGSIWFCKFVDNLDL